MAVGDYEDCHSVVRDSDISGLYAERNPETRNESLDYLLKGSGAERD